MKKKLRKVRLGCLGLKPNGKLTRYESLLELHAERFVDKWLANCKKRPTVVKKTKAELKGKRRKERWDCGKRDRSRTDAWKAFLEFCKV